jgi:hypothetical protein
VRALEAEALRILEQVEQGEPAEQGFAITGESRGGAIPQSTCGGI